MTQLEVMKAFMARLANHGYSVSNATATNMLNSAVVASSRFTSINEVIQSMKDDQLTCEANAIYNVVTTVLGADWYLEKCVNYLTDDNENFVLDEKGQKQIASFKTLSEIETLLSTAKKADNSDVTYDDVKDFTAAQSYTSLSNVIKEVTANDFLKNCCGIQLNENYYISGSTILSAGNSDNTDTGAITGSDANTVYHKEDFTEEKWEQAKTLFPKYYDAVLSEDETTLTIGKSTTKTAEEIVPETWINTYIATTNQAQKITTGTRDWVVKATAANDTIISGGADSINAGAGNDEINIAGNGATVTSGAGEDTIEISSDVKKVTITDLTADDTLTIAGSFEVGAAKIEDMMLVITDKTGTRKITLGDFENNAKNGKINLGDASTTIAKWLTDSGINLDNLEKTTYAASVGVTPVTTPETSTATEAAVETHDVSSTVEVNLKDYLNNAEGNLEVDSKTVGTLSSTFPNASTFTRNGLTIHLLGITEDNSGRPTNEKNVSLITAQNYDQLTADQKAIVAALFKWWGSEALKLNDESYGISFTSDNAKVTDIGLYFYKGTGNTLATVWNWQRKSSDGEATQLMLNVNMKYYNGLTSNTNNTDIMNGKSSLTSFYLDRTLSHEMTHAIMAANVNYFNNLPKFIKEGIAELTHGIDDERGDIIFKNAYDAEQLEGSLDMTNTGTGSQKVGDAYAGGYMFLRYFAYQSALQTLAMPAYGEITVDVDLSQLDSLADGNVLYVDTSTTNPTVQVAKDMNAYNETDAQNHYNLLNLGSIGADGSGDLYYYVASDWIKQNIKTSANIHDVYGVNANITVTGTGDYDGVQLYEGNTEINTGGGADFISASGQYATINTGADNDIVNINEGSHHNINLGEGNNQLLIQGIPSVITTSEGAVSHLNTSSNYGHIITGGAGADTVTNGISVYYLSAKNADGTYGAYNVADDYIFYIDNSTLVQVTDGSYFDQNKKYYAATGFDENNNINESIEVTPYNFYQYNYEYQMDLGDGDNVVKLSTFENSSLTTGAGNDIIAFTSSNETSNKISSGAGNDSVIFGSLNDNNALNSYTKLNKNYVDLGAGNDTITFGGSYNSIIGGKGNDQITKANDDGDNNVYIYNSDFGADQISGFTKDDKICIANGYTATASEVSNNKVTVTVKGGDTEKGTINITLASGATFNADTNIYNSGTASENIEFNVTETGRKIKLTDDVSDVIYIDATNFNDTENLGTLTLDGKFGEDDKIIVYVGEKYTNPDTCTVTQDGKSALINVTHNNTNYTIKVVNAFSESINFGDTVSKNHTLDGTYTKTGIKSTDNEYTFGYTAETKELTLGGVIDATGITVDGATISVNTSSIYTEGNAKGTVTLDTTADITLEVTGKNLREIRAGWTLENSVATYSDISTKGYYVDVKSIKYNEDEHDKSFTISGLYVVSSVDDLENGIEIDGTTVTINNEAFLNKDSQVTISEGYTLALGKDITKSTVATANLKQDETDKSKYIYTSASNTEGYKVENNKIIYKQENFTSFEISGLADGVTLGNGITVDGKTIKISASALAEKNATLTTSADYTLTLDGVTAPVTIDESWDGTTYKTGAVTTAGYTVNGNTITYSPVGNRLTLFSLSGVDSNDGFTVNKNENAYTVKVADRVVKNLNAETTITLANIDKNITATFAADTGLATSQTKNTAAKLERGKYTSSTYNAYTKFEDTTLTYYPATTAKEFTISNLSAAAKLGENVIVTDGNTTKFEFKAAALNKQNIEISGGTFEVVLNGDVDTVAEEIKADKTITKGILNYTSAGTGEFYTATASGVTYTGQVGGEQFKISGLSTSATLADGIEITKQGDGTFKIVFSDKNLLAKKSPTITTDETYTLEVAADIEPTVQNPAWKIKSAAATLSAATSEGYKVSNNKIVYFAESPGASLFEISGLAKNATLPELTTDAKTITLDATQLGNNAIIRGNAGNYSVKVEGDMTGKIFTGTSDVDKIKIAASNAVIKTNSGNDEINVTSENVTVIGGKGDDKITVNSSAFVSFDKESGNDTIYSYAKGMKLKLTASNYETKVSGSDVVVKIDDSTLTLENAAGTFNSETDIIQIYDSNSLPKGISVRRNTLTAAAAFTGEIDLSKYPEDIKNINAAAVTGNLTIKGNEFANSIKSGKGNDSIFGDAGNDKIYGEKGNDTISGGEGNDTLYGGDGKNIFVYTSGNDYIADYTAGSDSIKMDFTAETKTKVIGSNVILTIDSNNTVIIKSAKDKEVTFVNDAGESDTKIFFAETYYAPLEDGLKYDSKRVSLTAGSNFGGDEINLSNYLDTVAKVNASAVTKAFKITGKENQSYSILGGKGNNVINLSGEGKNSVRGGDGADNITGGTGNDILKGENGNDTLSGGAGNNTLTGGTGNDVFIYGGGNDYITDYAAGDSIKATFKTSTVQGSNVILTTESGTVTIKSAKNKTVRVVDDAGEINDLIFFNDTYYAPLDTGLTYNSSKTQLTADSKFTGTKINLPEDFLDIVQKVNAGAVKQAVEIVGNEKNNSIRGGNGNDTIIGNSGKNTIRGGNGADSIVGGTDADKLYGEVGNDTIIGGEGKDTLYGGTGADSINGGDGDDKILGEAGDDTLIGGAGNNTLTGGAGNDVFVVGAGNDFIADYTASDSVSIESGSISEYKYSGKNLTFTLDNKNTFTIKNAKGKEITINGDSKVYEVQKANAQTYDLLYDNNFTTDEFGIDDITEAKFEVTNIETQNNTEIAQDDKTLITYTDK